MFEECAPPIPVTILIGCSGFGNAVGSVKASNDIQEITFLGGCLMWNNAAVCGGRIWLIVFVSVWYDLWKYRDREYAMMFSVTLMYCDYMDVLLLTSVYPGQRDTASCNSEFTGLKDDLCIQPSALELHVNAKMCDPCTICRMVM